LGPEPLDLGLTPEELQGLLARSRSPIRSWLLDQTHIAGIGNIYASEALFRSGIHPRRPARSLGLSETEAFLEAMRAVLNEAIRARGTTLRDFRTASGDPGGFEPSLQAYGREGSPCPRCNTPIERIVFGNRSAFFCPHCQPPELQTEA
jgi:formamidopyrimidine-DNA glycosylase